MSVIREVARYGAAALLVLSLAGCSGGASSPVAPIASQPVPGGASPAGAVDYGAGILAGATFVKRAQLKLVGLDVVVAMRDLPGLFAYAKESNDPKSPLFRHWLTPPPPPARFGATPGDYANALKYFLGSGIAVKTYPQRQILRIAGSQANVERALGVEFGFFRKSGQTILAPVAAPRPPAALRIAALGNAVGFRTKSRRLVTLRAATSFVEGYSAQQLANVFDYTGAYAAGFKGDGITIGIIGTGAIADGDARVGGGDVAEYRALFGLHGSGTVVQDVDVANVSPGNTTFGNGDEFSGGLATPPPVTSPTASGCVSQGYAPGDPIEEIGDYTTCNPEDIEAQLDTEQTSALAPDATVNFYIAYNPMECNGTCGASGSFPPIAELGLLESDDETQQAIADNKSDVISMSFGEDEATSEATPNPGGYFGPGTNNFGPMEYAALASEGTALFASSGDNGAEACADGGIGNPDQPCVSYPATDPSVTSVGGVNAPLDDSGRLTGPITGWGTQTQFPGQVPGGSGGGCSTFFSEPSYASGAGLPCGGKRSQPDAALDADTNTGVAVVTDSAPSLGGRAIFTVGGTSVSSPEMAAMWALVLQACKLSAPCTAHGSGATPYRLGNPGTYLYKVYLSQTQYPATFYDVLFGNNALPGSSGSLDPGFAAGKGYDQVTGIGVPFARSLITSVLADVP